MQVKSTLAVVLGFILNAQEPPPRHERGLSQSAETAILIAGAVAVAILVVTIITRFVTAKMNNLGP